jgi:hypothetical protein
MEEGLKLTKVSTVAKVDAMCYQSIVRGLQYLTHTQLAISFAIGYVSRLVEDLQEDRWAAMKHLLCYIKRMTDQGMFFPRPVEQSCD